MVEVAIEIKKYLVTNDVCNSTGVVLLIVHQAYIALPQIVKGVIYQELYFGIECRFEFFLNLGQALFSITGGVHGKFFPVEVKINVELVEFIECPELIEVLHPVFAESHLRSGIKLRPQNSWFHQQSEDD